MEPASQVVHRTSTHLLEICAVRANPGYASHRTTCPDGQFWLTVHGDLTVMGEAGKSRHRPQELAYYAPREGAIRTAEEPVRAYGIQVKLSRLAGEDHDPHWRKIGPRGWADYRCVTQLLRIARGVDPDPHRLDELASEWLHSRQGFPSERGIPGWMNRAEEIVAADPGRPLAEVAREVGVVPAYLSAQYRRLRGVPLSQFRRRTMVQRALALHGELPLASAAIEAGFYDASHFHRTCVAELGAKPTELAAWMQI